MDLPQQDPPTTTSTSSPYNPTPADTLLVRSYLSRLNLPTELALAIIDFAQYYPLARGHTLGNFTIAASTHRLNSAALLLVVSDPIPSGTKGERLKPRSVKFKLRSHDQGWGGERGCRGRVPSHSFHYIGTYSGSYTWFEACILRPLPTTSTSTSTSRPALTLPYTFNPYPTAVCLRPVGFDLVHCSASSRETAVMWHIQSNVCASSEEKVHEVEWRRGAVQEIEPGKGIGKDFVEKLRPGDRVGVWARALYPGWVNHVKEVGVEIVVEVD
ncbi:hypothetical protein K432DRAFT_67438 [Lepidopterella palustris CBS 459.81]|uniref:Uncharacterized protein n=1 Tax=Lepidopterella palustris CBS 459.81 TaxID=1314670 RepID=A0A8E2EJG0_9PEZI|nr:hypothetical protein K432DRAFT_67438 [Lepidopterella palustris CBS 459.81]